MTSPQHPLTIDQRLSTALADRYRIERELGQGGMATVYLAEDLKHHRKVAIKILRPELAAVVGADRFVREIETTAALQHPHILGLIDSGEVNGTAYYVMPFVEGESLRDRITREKQLPLDDALRMAREVADALSYAHNKGVIHRDIKPENILLTSGHAVVADFGIARAISAAGGERLTETGLAVGTPAYMSPEQAAGDRDLDGRSDLYALACVLYEMLAGEPPFRGPTVQDVVRQHLTIEPRSVTQLRPAVPAEVAEALNRALAKTPADRFNPVGQFSEALGRGTPAAREGTTRAIPTPRSRAPAIAGVVAILALGGIGLWYWRHRGVPPLEVQRRTQVTIDPGIEIDPALSPDGKFVAYSGAKGAIMVRQVGGGVPIAVVRDGGGTGRWPAWTPDGQRLVYISPRGFEIVPALGGSSRLVRPASGLPRGVAVSPDGKDFVFASHDSVFVQPLDREEPRLVTIGWEVHSLAWSRDGRWIAFVSGNPQYIKTSDLGNFAPSSIWLAPAAGGPPVRVTDQVFLNVSPAWAPDGSLLYISTRDGGRDAYQQHLTKSGTPSGTPTRLTTGLEAFEISMSSDGS
ncbi:MAG TPA: protein kinase, partial [Gemmatimonadales bacterium]|nr:protein kinase [Gemmatimonadales bacterium]